MLTVRLPNGVAVTYNAATNFEYHNGNLRFVDAKGLWVAEVQASAGATVERVAPCKVTQTINDTDAAIAHLLGVIEQGDTLPWQVRAKLSDLKRALGQSWDARRQAWK